MLELRTDDHVRGDGCLVVVYADFTCPHCAVLHQRLRVRGDQTHVFRHLALKAKHPRAVAVGRAAEAAGRQGSFWAFHDSLYDDQAHLDDPHLWERVTAMGLDLDRFEADRRDPEIAARVEAQTREAVLAGAVTTPTLLARVQEVHKELTHGLAPKSSQERQ